MPDQITEPILELQFKTFDAHFKALDTSNPAGGFEGYVATFGNVDSYGDVIIKGAFSKTIPDFLKNGFIALNHDWMSDIGYPIEAKEDDIGLWIAAEFHDTAFAQDQRKIMAKRMEKGLSVRNSIGYFLPAGGYEYTDTNRILKEIDLIEASYVKNPANGLAITTGVKGFNPLAGEPMSFTQHSETLLAMVKGYINRANDIQQMRLKEGRTISTANYETLNGILTELKNSAGSLEAVLTSMATKSGNGAAGATAAAELEAEALALYSQTLAIKARMAR